VGRDSDLGPPEYEALCIPHIFQIAFFFRYKVSVTAKDPEVAYMKCEVKDNFDPFRERKLDHPTT
jgi:hypothetical protein